MGWYFHSLCVGVSIFTRVRHLLYSPHKVGKKLLSEEEAADGGANDLCRLLEAKATLVEWPPCSSSTSSTTASGSDGATEEDSATSVHYAQPNTFPPTGSLTSASTTSTEGVRRCLLVELVGDRFLRRMVRSAALIYCTILTSLAA